MNSERPALRVYRALLILYPREFRDEYGADMVRLLRDQSVDEPAWKVHARAVLDLAITIPTQHLEAHMRLPSTHLVPLLYTALAGGGLLLAVSSVRNPTIVTIGLCIALVAGITAAIAWRRSGPIGNRISTQGWWKLVLAGPCIIVGVIVAAGIGVDAWMVGMFAVFAAFLVSAIGVLLGIAHFAKRHTSAIPT